MTVSPTARLGLSSSCRTGVSGSSSRGLWPMGWVLPLSHWQRFSHREQVFPNHRQKPQVDGVQVAAAAHAPTALSFRYRSVSHRSLSIHHPLPLPSFRASEGLTVECLF